MSARQACSSVTLLVLSLIEPCGPDTLGMCQHSIASQFILQGEEVDVSVPPSHTLAISDELHATAVPHRLGGSSYSVALVEGVVSHPDPHHVSVMVV
jgi:hypothetical protein